MDKVTNYLSTKSFQNNFQSFQNVFTIVHPAAFAISVRDRPPLNVFDVDTERRERVLNVLVWIPAFCKISDTYLVSVLDDTGLCGGA